MILSSLLLPVVLAAGTLYASKAPMIRVPLTEKRSSLDTFSKRDEYKSSLYNSRGSQYLISLTIGTPGQKFSVTLDTGSGDLWVPSTACPANVCPVPRYNPSASSTYNATNVPFRITYGIGAANGTFIRDTVTIGNAAVQQQQLAIATSSSDIFTRMTSVGLQNTTASDQVPASGILGLGYPGLTSVAHQNGSAYNPFVFNLVQQNLIQHPIFSIYLNNADTKGWSGEIIFGGVDETKYSGAINYVPVQQTSTSSAVAGSKNGYMFWTVFGQGFAVIGGQQSNPNIQYSTPIPTIIDTGSTLSYLPSEMISTIVQAISGPGIYQQDANTGMFKLDCSVTSQNITVQLQMTPSSSATHDPVVINTAINDLILQDRSGCYLGLAPSESHANFGSTTALIGQSILRSAYMVFDIGQNRIGFAQTVFTSGDFSSSSNSSGTNNGSSAGGAVSANTGSSLTVKRWQLLVAASLLCFYFSM